MNGPKAKQEEMESEEAEEIFIRLYLFLHSTERFYCPSSSMLNRFQNQTMASSSSAKARSGMRLIYLHFTVGYQ